LAVDNTVQPLPPVAGKHDQKVNRIADIAPVRNYAQRLVSELEADKAEPQGLRSINIVKLVDGYNRALVRLTWDREVVRNAKSELLTPNEWLALATPKLWPRNDTAQPTAEEVAEIAEALQNAALPTVVDFNLNDQGALTIEPEMPPALRFSDNDKRWVVKRRWQGHWVGKQVIVRLDPKQPDDQRLLDLHFGDDDEQGDEPKQQPAEQREQKKFYLSFVKLSDGRWIASEPDTPVPLWGLENVRPGSFVWVHEGPRKAAAAQAAANDPKHPWSELLAYCAHVAWTTGAHRVDQADWHELIKLRPEQVVVVPDNDDPGRAAVPLIAQQLKGVPLLMVQWDADWPIGFDLADPFPAKLFDKTSGRYTGPLVAELLLPATWATDIKGFNDNGKPIIVLRPEFVKPWRYVQDVERFVHLHNPCQAT
jgi:hypothetical protein